MMEQDNVNAEVAPAEDPQDTLVINAAAELAELAAQRDQLERDKQELADRALRMAAEFDNFRKRSERERADFIQYAALDAVKALLPVVDDFARALKAECADAEYARGIGLIEQRLNDVLSKLGLEPVEAAGKPFDPNLHHAIDRVESSDIEEDTVALEYQRGFTFKGRLLRPAMVRVAVKA